MANISDSIQVAHEVLKEGNLFKNIEGEFLTILIVISINA